MKPTWFQHDLHRRAPRGGELDTLNHRRYRGGEFEAWDVPRDVMPQIDEQDYPALFAFARDRGVQLVSTHYTPPTQLRPHQHIDKLKAKHIGLRSAVMSKPILVSDDSYILDGNHRWLAHVIADRSITAYKLNLTFEHAIAFLFQFPATYYYGDGHHLAIRD